MRKFLCVVGALALVVLIVGGVALGVLAYKGNKLDAESKEFVDRGVPAIAASLSAEQFLEQSTQELREATRAGDLRAVFDVLARLGPLVVYEGATGQASMTYMAGTEGTVSATYVANARFQNGTAVFRILLMKRDGRWLFHGFHVDPAWENRVDQAT